MRIAKIVCLSLVASSFALLSAAHGQQAMFVASRATVPIIITRDVSAKTARPGDLVYAKTSQRSQLPNGVVVPSGTRVLGHVISTSGPVQRRKLVYDDVAPVSSLTIRFDSLELAHEQLPITAYGRAMADPFESESARMSQPSDIDPQSTTTQIGGDLLTPSQRDIVDQDGHVVGHNLRHGAYARLRHNGSCLGTDVEVSVGIYSGSACGLYGFTEVRATGVGTLQSRDITLSSSMTTARIWRDSTALLELVNGAGQFRE